jgi:membrane protein YqaA with SNARE-associated domain
MRLDYKSLLALVISTVLVIIPFAILGDYFDHWATAWLSSVERHSLLLAIAIALLAADALLPVPSSVVSALVIESVGPLWGGGAVWLGTLLGSLLGYGFGLAARYVLPPAASLTASDLTKRIGVWAVFVTKGVPVLGEAVALTAGALRLPFYSFAVVSALASLVLALAYAATAALVPGSIGQVPLMFFAALMVPLVSTLILNRFIRVTNR